jgi:hypothetical protein
MLIYKTGSADMSDFAEIVQVTTAENTSEFEIGCWFWIPSKNYFDTYQQSEGSKKTLF